MIGIETVNVNLETGIRYCFGHGNMINCDALSDITGIGEDLTYSDAIKEFHDDLKEFLEDHYVTLRYADLASFDDSFNASYCSDSAVYLYKEDGYEIAYDNNTNDITILKSPYFTYRGLCSPCAPNGCYLSSDGSLKAYCLDASFFDDYNPMPYDEYYRVSDGSKVEI